MPWPSTKNANDRVTYQDWNAVINALQAWPGHGNANSYNLANVGTIFAKAIAAPAAAPADADIPNSAFSVWYDQDNSRLVFRVRSSTGALKTGELSLV